MEVTFRSGSFGNFIGLRAARHSTRQWNGRDGRGQREHTMSAACETCRQAVPRHYQLRDIMSDPQREISLVDLNHDTAEVLHYAFPTLPVVHSSTVEVTGYPGARTRITIHRNEERYDDPASDTSRPAGLLIKGRRGIYENAFFKFEGNQFAGWFSGRIECPFIDQLAEEYDRRLENRKPQDSSNPVPIITRRRDGLQHAHPFYKALAAAVEPILGELIRDEEQRAKQHAKSESIRMRRTLDALGRDLSRLIDEDFAKWTKKACWAQGTDSLPPLKLVPEQAVLYLGEDKTISVIVRADLGIDEVASVVEPGGVVELVDGSTTTLAPHKRRPDVLIGQIRLRPLLEDDTLPTVLPAPIRQLP